MQTKSTRSPSVEAGASTGSGAQEPAADFGSNSSNLAVMTSVRPRARPVRTFADGGGYTYVARSDGAYVITGAPRPSAVGLIVREGNAWQAIHDLYLSIAPVGRRMNEPFEAETEAEVVAPDVDATQTQTVPDEPEPADDEPVVSSEDPSLWERVAEDVKDGVSDVVEFISDWWDTLGTAEAAEQTKEAETEAPAQDPVAESTDPFVVARGQLTFDAEGTEGGAFHTRTAHWPGGASGVTIGRGYDLGHNSEADILRHMESAGISASDAALFAGAAGITGTDARAWLNGHRNELPEITPEQQNLLFDIVYSALADDVERISGNYARIVSEREDGEREDYEIDWDTLHPAIRDLVVDLRYRGDYTRTTRVYVQPLAIANDLRGMADLMADRTRWSSVPQDRFNRRAQYMRAAVEGGVTAPLEGEGQVEDDAATETDAGGEAAAVISTANAGTGYRVAATTLNVRRTPSSDTNGNRVGQLRSGALITATGQTEGWIQFLFDGATAYVSADYLVEVQNGEEQTTGGGALSGGHWYDIANANGWANSTSFDDLSSDFGPRARTFVEGLRSSGASVDVTSGLRHPKRAILMHFAWHVSRGTKSTDVANAHCAANGIDIEWNHGNAAASRAAAQELVSRFSLVRSASLTSNHMGGDAIDMRISNVPASLVVDGRTFEAGPKGDGTYDEDKVDHIGAELGVIWFGPGDYVHWSKTGR